MKELDRRRSGVALRCMLTLLLLSAAGCSGGDEASDHPDVRASIVAGLIAGQEGLQRDQVRTFQADVRARWVAAYDPADPPGCVSGGLRTGSPRSCTAYVLQRRKTRWAVVAFGRPGQMFVPDNAPEDLGAHSKLGWLAE